MPGQWEVKLEVELIIGGADYASQKSFFHTLCIK
jgi:hypothetical protein